MSNKQNIHANNHKSIESQIEEIASNIALLADKTGKIYDICGDKNDSLYKIKQIKQFYNDKLYQDSLDFKEQFAKLKKCLIKLTHSVKSI
ncbi:MAG: hypothetical protein IJ848_03655 [Alphaproteobacteria bacterium]|nr:hypothetical protein [Alphaproteobacteria bacterium]